MKKCPFCAEDIQEAAIKCKHCGEFLNTLPTDEPGPMESPAPRRDDRIRESETRIRTKKESGPAQNQEKALLSWVLGLGSAFFGMGIGANGPGDRLIPSLICALFFGFIGYFAPQLASGSKGSRRSSRSKRGRKRRPESSDLAT